MDHIKYDNTYFQESTVGTEWTIHQTSPYIGKIKSSIAAHLVKNYTKKNNLVVDPFSGAGTIPFEAWAAGRTVIANDLSSYAHVLTLGKLYPCPNEQVAREKIDAYQTFVTDIVKQTDIRNIPQWVQDFFHPETLKEIACWIDILKANSEWFILSCLLGILHHQRPGFLSFPASHTVPYLRTTKFPKDCFPDLYEYRNVADRLRAKVFRALRRMPALDYSKTRQCLQMNAVDMSFGAPVDAIITSPPYMRQLTYARDNRLRLWFLGDDDITTLEDKISPRESSFTTLMEDCFDNWTEAIKRNGHCILFIGDNLSSRTKKSLPELIIDIAVSKKKSFKLVDKYETAIPTIRRVRRSYSGNKVETVIVLKSRR